MAALEPMVYAEDFGAAVRAAGEWQRARLLDQAAEASAHGRARGGQRCCGTTGRWHRPWCWRGPRHHRAVGERERI